MWTHIFTLHALAKELNTVLRDAAILEIFTQRKNELLISTTREPRIEETLTISIDPKMNFVLLRSRIARAKKNSVGLFPEVTGAHISSVSAHRQERLIFFNLDVNLRFCVQLFGTAESNIFLIDEQGYIRKAFKNTKKFAGKKFDIDEKQHEENILQDLTLFTVRLLQQGLVSTFAALKSTLPFLGSTFTREVLHRAGVDEKSQISELSKPDIEEIYTEIIQLMNETHTSHPTVYFRNNEPRVFSVIPLRHLAGAYAEHFNSVNNAIRAFVFRSLRTQGIDTVKKELIRRLKRERDRTQRALTAVREQLSQTEAADKYERIAKVVMANLQHLTKGTTVVELEDIFTDSKMQLRITMDPKLTPVQNAEWYFAKAKKVRAAHREIEHRARDLEEKAALLEKLLLHLDYCQTKEQLDEFQQEHRSLLQKWNVVTAKDDSERLPFRVFMVGGKFDVWAGKSSANNDLLTLRHAKPNDLWFHARGASGSHVILKVGGGKTKPSKEAIHEAARIAAYYSKMRNASIVPVAYCERKYVRKPRGAEPGSVVMQREKVIFVEPGLP